MSSDAAARSIADLGEDGLIAAILAEAQATHPGVLLGAGDDAAVLRSGGNVVVSTDMMVHGRDFRLDWSTAYHVGRKLVVQNLMDVVAMGGRPTAMLVALGAPADTPVQFVQDLATGIRDECGRAGACLVGGDLSDADQIVLTGTSLGEITTSPVRRGGATAGNIVALAGNPGLSAAGLALLHANAGRSAGNDTQRAIDWHRCSQPDYRWGAVAAALGATAMIDTSDGLARDATRIAEAGGFTIDIDPAAVPTDPVLHTIATHVGDPKLAQTWALTGGEDHNILACFPADARIPAEFVTIGTVKKREAKGVPLTVAGQPWSGESGWHHWEN